jgi:hypothetical protein
MLQMRLVIVTIVYLQCLLCTNIDKWSHDASGFSSENEDSSASNIESTSWGVSGVYAPPLDSGDQQASPSSGGRAHPSQ